jgi:hypothetical protein
MPMQMAQVSRRPVAMASRVRARVSPRGIFSGHTGSGIGFSPNY